MNKKMRRKSFRLRMQCNFGILDTQNKLLRSGKTHIESVWTHALYCTMAEKSNNTNRYKSRPFVSNGFTNFPQHGWPTFSVAGERAREINVSCARLLFLDYIIVGIITFIRHFLH